ncbi:MAG: right-handed parallel beta-helix repeat-containing protein [Acidimicrobiales bacterium]
MALVLPATSWAKPAQAGHVGCGDTVTQDTTLDSDVGPCPGNGIIVGADNIALDLNGYTVTGDPHARQAPDKAGVLLRNVSGVTVRDGTVERFDAGVAIMGGGGNTVTGVTARENLNYRVVTGRDARPNDVDPDEGPFCDFGDGITVFNSTDNVIERNVLVGNGPFSGVSLVYNSDGNVVARNDIHDNDLLNQAPAGERTICGGLGTPQQPMEEGRVSQDAGVRIEGPGADSNLVEANRIQRSGLSGVFISGYQMGVGSNNGGNLIRRNHISETGLRTHDSEGDGSESYRSSGITLHHAGTSVVHVSHGNIIEENNSSRNFGAGIEITGPTPGSGRVGHAGNTIRGNVANNNFLDGIHLSEGTVDTTVSANRAHGNGRDSERVAEISDADRYSNWAGVDGGDYNPDCGTNVWSGNRFGTVNQSCVAANGTGWVGGPGRSGNSQGQTGGPLSRRSGN